MSQTIDAALYLIPVQLSDGAPLEQALPTHNAQVVAGIRHFIVENVRSARRFIKRAVPTAVIDDLTFLELNRHTQPEQVSGYLAALEAGEPMGVISEAGCPAIADPGADVVAIAQRKGLRVVPLVGPSSIIMGLMGSGFNGQSFAFVGYLPIDGPGRARKFKEMEHRIVHESQTQIFIETPYRNQQLLQEMCRVLPAKLRLCVATDITGPGERIVTRSIGQWAKAKPTLGKVPTIFLLYK